MVVLGSCQSCSNLLHFSQDIVTRHLTEKSAAEDQLPVSWAAGSQSDMTPSQSPVTSDAVRYTLSLLSVVF